MSYQLVKPPVGTQLNMSHPLSQGLVGCWLFNEGAGNKALDSSGQGNHGTLTNIDNPGTATSGWTSGPNGGSLLFDGSDDYINCGTATSLLMPTSGSVTIASHFYCTINNTWNAICSKGAAANGYSYGLVDVANTLRWINTTTGWSLGFGLTNTWHTAVSVTTAAGTYGFVDGLFSGTGIVAGATTSACTGGPFMIGNIGLTINCPFKGYISDVMVWNRNLSTAEISSLYGAPYQMFFGGDVDIDQYYQLIPPKGRLFGGSLR